MDRQKGHLSRDIHKLYKNHNGNTTPGANCVPWSTKHFEFVVLYHAHTVTHLKRFSKRYELATLDAAGVSS